MDQELKSMKIGKQVGSIVRETLKSALGSSVAVGMGSYGRGAYGRGVRAYGSGAYGRSTPAIAVNSLFKEYKGKRSSQREFGDETERVKVCRREYVMRVVAPAVTEEFVNTSFSINPGLSGVFAWLSQVAVNYDEYTLEHLVFHYKPVISQASTTGAMGSILMSANYNSGAQKFDSFREMAEYTGTLETRVCDEALFGVECAPSKNSSMSGTEYVRAGAVPQGQDIKTYDLALFQIATSDVQTFAEGTLLGHLYVEYEVVLGKPKLYSALGKTILADMWKNDSDVSDEFVFGFVSNPVPNPANLLDLQLLGNDIYFPPNFYGRVEVTYHLSTPLGTIVSLTPTAGAEVQPVANLGSNGTSTFVMSNSHASSIIQAQFDVNAAHGGVPNGITIELSIGALAAGMSLTVTQVNPLFHSY